MSAKPKPDSAEWWVDTASNGERVVAAPSQPTPERDTPQQMAERLEAMLRGNAAAIDLEPGEVELIRAAADMLRACPSVEAREDAIAQAFWCGDARHATEAEFDASLANFKRARLLLGLPVEP